MFKRFKGLGFLQIFIFLFLLVNMSFNVVSLTPNFKNIKNNFYNQDVDLGVQDLPQETFFVNLNIFDKDMILFDKNYTKQNALSIPFNFSKIYPSTLTVKYTFYNNDYKQTDFFESSLLLLETPVFNFNFCYDAFCETKEVYGKVFDTNMVYLSSSLNKDTLFNLDITNLITLEKENFPNITLPKKLDLKQGVYKFEISFLHQEDILFQKELLLEVFSESQTITPINYIKFEGYTPDVEPDDLNKPIQNQTQTKKSSSKTYLIIILLVIILIFYILFRNKKSSKKATRRTSRKISLFFIIIFLMFFSINSFAISQYDEYEFSFFYTSLEDLKERFPIPDQLDIYISKYKQNNSVYLPLVSFNIEDYQYPMGLSTSIGNLEYTPLNVLFLIDKEKIEENTAGFLPTQPPNPKCEYVIDFFKSKEIRTKADLVNLQKQNLIDVYGFDETCLDHLIKTNWIKEKQILAKINFTPNDFSSLKNGVYNSNMVFTANMLTKITSIPIYINKINYAELLVKPRYESLDELTLLASEKALVLNHLTFDYNEKIFNFNLSSNKPGGGLHITLENYNNGELEFDVKHLNQSQKLKLDISNNNDILKFTEKGEENLYVTNLSKFSSLYILNYMHVKSLTNIKTIDTKKRFLQNIFNRSSVYSGRTYDVINPINYSKSIEFPYILDFPFDYLLKFKDGKILIPLIKMGMYIFYDISEEQDNKIDFYFVEEKESGDLSISEKEATFDPYLEYFVFGNNILEITNIKTIQDKTYFTIEFKEFKESIVVPLKLKSYKDNYFIYKNKYVISTSGDRLNVYEINEPFFRNNKSLDFDEINMNTKKYMLGEQAKYFINNESSYKIMTTSNLKKFNSYIFDISTSNYFSKMQTYLFYAKQAYISDFGNKSKYDWVENSFCENKDIHFPFLKEHLKNFNFTTLKYYGFYETPFSVVLEDTKNYIIPRNTFETEHYDLLCNHLTKSDSYSEYTYFILNSANFLKEQSEFINFIDNQDFENLQEGILFYDDGDDFLTYLKLNFNNNNYNDSLYILSNFFTINQLFDVNLDNTTSKEMFKANYIDIKNRNSLRFKLPIRNEYFTDEFIKTNYVDTNDNLTNCSLFSTNVLSNYNYNDIHILAPTHLGYLNGNFILKDAWDMRKANQVIWNYKDDESLNHNNLFEGLMLGVYIGKTEYTLSNGSVLKNLLYTHVVPYIDNYENKSNIILNSGSGLSVNRSVNAYNYYTTNNRKLREILVPYGYYDNTIKDVYGKTELDYVKEYLTVKH